MSAPDRSDARALEDALYFVRKLPVSEGDGLARPLLTALRRLRAASDPPCSMPEEQARTLALGAIATVLSAELLTPEEREGVLAWVERQYPATGLADGSAV